MKHHRAATEILRPVGHVFGVLADLSNDAAWRYDVGESRLVSGVAGASGARYRQAGPDPRKPQPYHVEATRVDEEARVISFATVDAAPVAVRGTYRVEPMPGGSRVEFDIELHPGGVVKLFEPFMGAALRKTTARYLGDLKRHLEGPSPGAARP